MNGEAEEASENQRKTVAILSLRTREILRLVEKLHRRRQRPEHGSAQAILGDKRLIFAAIGFTIGLAGVGIAEFTQTTPKTSVVTSATQEPVRIVGPAFVPNINPREH